MSTFSMKAFSMDIEQSVDSLAKQKQNFIEYIQNIIHTYFQKSEGYDHASIDENSSHLKYTFILPKVELKLNKWNWKTFFTEIQFDVIKYQIYSCGKINDKSHVVDKYCVECEVELHMAIQHIVKNAVETELPDSAYYACSISVKRHPESCEILGYPDSLQISITFKKK